MVTLSIISVLVIGATCGLGSWLLVKDDSQVVGAGPSDSPTTPRRDINDRKTDPTPLTAADVFPVKEIIADPAIPPYKRVGNPQVEKNCRVAATADLGKLLNRLGCNQVVRATFTSPDGAFFVTAGIFNLRDSAATSEAHQQMSKMINKTNRLTGYIANTSARVLGRAPTNLAWYAQGHFIIYVVIARVDGKDIGQDDAHVRVMVYDILEKYLRDKVIEEWSIDRSTPGPSASGSASANPSAS